MDHTQSSLARSSPGVSPIAGLGEPEALRIGSAPTLSNQAPQRELDQMLRVARRFDVAGREERNRALGQAEEEHVLVHEQAVLTGVGLDALARKLRWMSE